MTFISPNIYESRKEKFRSCSYDCFLNLFGCDAKTKACINYCTCDSVCIDINCPSNYDGCKGNCDYDCSCDYYCSDCSDCNDSACMGCDGYCGPDCGWALT